MASAALWLYRAITIASLPLIAPALWISDRRRGKMRPPLSQRFGLDLPELPRGSVWIQAVSVGEVLVARSVIGELRKTHPPLPIVLSATTSTGLRMATGALDTDAVVPYPIDLPGPVRRFTDALQPKLVILVETELWPEMLAACANRGIPVALVNARVSDRSFRGYWALRALMRQIVKPVTLALAQSQQDADRLVAIGIPAGRVQVTGNIKFDQALPKPAPSLEGRFTALAAGRPIWVAGSTMPGEEELVLAALTRMPIDQQPFLLLAPRHPERCGAVLDILARRDIPAIRRTQLDTAGEGLAAVVLDTVGELASLYAIAKVAFIGGSLVSTGGHNPIEPALFGVPVLVGPHLRNFALIYKHFVAAGAARIVHNQDELGDALLHWLTDQAAAERAGQAGRDLLATHSGATARCVKTLEPFLR